MKKILLLLVVVALVRAESPLVIQTDFGTKDGAVSAMRGVAVGVDPHIAIYDLSHENTPFDIWEAAYRLKQAAPYWPAGTVFVSVIDPGVGTDAQIRRAEDQVRPLFCQSRQRHAHARGRGTRRGGGAGD